MKNLIPSLRTLGFLIPMLILAGIFAYTANADSIISIPVPEGYRDKQVTISLRIPPNTEPIERDTSKPKLQSRKSLIIWNSNPSPKIDSNDELHAVNQVFLKKGWVTSQAVRNIVRMRPLDRFYAVRAIQHISSNVINIGQAPNFHYVVKNCNLTPSDIEDLRRMIKRFETDLIKFGSNPENMDKDLLMLQEKFKSARQGVLKVLRVEGGSDGSTLIHLTVD